MHASFRLTCVAYARSTGGTMRVLLTVDRDDEPLFNGDPVLLVEHRPGDDSANLRVEGPDAMRTELLDLVHVRAAAELARIVDGAFDRTGGLQPELLLGRHVALTMAADAFDD